MFAASNRKIIVIRMKIAKLRSGFHFQSGKFLKIIAFFLHEIDVQCMRIAYTAIYTHTMQNCYLIKRLNPFLCGRINDVRRIIQSGIHNGTE